MTDHCPACPFKGCPDCRYNLRTLCPECHAAEGGD